MKPTKFKKGDICRIDCKDSAYHASVVEIVDHSGWVMLPSKKERSYNCKIILSALPWATDVVIVRETQLEIINEQDQSRGRV
jgi:hypothetical protein